MPIPQSEIGIYWNNLKTGESEYLTTAPIERMEEFIPQLPAAQNLYRIHLKLGKTPLDAAREVLEVVTRAQERVSARSAEPTPHPEGD
jgi:hypothetical protein